MSQLQTSQQVCLFAIWCTEVFVHAGGEILRTSGLKATYMTGNGGILMRGTVEIEEEKPRPGRGKKTRNRNAIVITELPYMTNKVHPWTPTLHKLKSLGPFRRACGSFGGESSS